MVTDVALERGKFEEKLAADDDGEEEEGGSNELLSARRLVFPFKRSSSAGVNVLSSSL